MRETHASRQHCRCLEASTAGYGCIVNPLVAISRKSFDSVVWKSFSSSPPSAATNAVESISTPMLAHMTSLLSSMFAAQDLFLLNNHISSHAAIISKKTTGVYPFFGTCWPKFKTGILERSKLESFERSKQDVTSHSPRHDASHQAKPPRRRAIPPLLSCDCRLQPPP